MADTNRKKHGHCALLVSLGICCIIPVLSELRIGVLKKNGDLMEEILKADVDLQTISLEFRTNNGNHITQTVDKINNVQIIRVYKLGEMEVQEPIFKAMCFVLFANSSEFISADAMSKLRQKNPGNGRVADVDKGTQNYTMDYRMDLRQMTNGRAADLVSPIIARECADAVKSVYTREQDVALWSVGSSVKKRLLFPLYPKHATDKAIVSRKYQTEGVSACGVIHHAGSSCECTVHVPIDWYPCKLKYCSHKVYDEEQKKYVMAQRRCGIHTCKQAYIFKFYVPQKDMCLPDY